MRGNNLSLKLQLFKHLKFNFCIIYKIINPFNIMENLIEEKLCEENIKE